MPYFIGGEITDRSKMAVQTPQALKDRFNLDVRTATYVVQIQSVHKTVIARNLLTGEQYTETYDHLVLALGAEPLLPPFPGIDRPGLFALRNLYDMDAIVAWMNTKACEHCVVAGAGFIGLEMVEQMHRCGIKVTLVEMQKQILGPLDEEMAAIVHRDVEAQCIEVVVGDGIRSFVADDSDPDACVLTIQSGRVLPWHSSPSWVLVYVPTRL